MTELRLHNTLTRRKELFVPQDPANVRMYVCGPTVYQRIHVGNARPLVVFDVLFRLLRHLYGDDNVTYVRNITDIEDKIIAQAAANGEPIETLTARTTVAFLNDTIALGCLPPTRQPKATQHVRRMIELIEALIVRGHAYTAEGHVLFHVPSMPDYGRLSGSNRDEMIAGARVEVAPYKRDPADFVLWKPAGAGEPGWDSPWGRGRPGWHIECSAMSEALLGPLPFDIHGGGQDLIFPHHENEIAQTRCAHGLPGMAKYWLHNGFVDMQGEKMSKSVGNVVRMNEALELVPGEALRLFLLTTHYRQPVNLDGHGLGSAKSNLDSFYNALSKIDASPYSEEHATAGKADGEVVHALADDLNIPSAMSRMHSLLTDLNILIGDDPNSFEAAEVASTIRASAEIMGLLQKDSRLWLLGKELPRSQGAAWRRVESEEKFNYFVADLIKVRTELRDKRQFESADKLRDALQRYGIILEDGVGGTSWRRP